MTQSTYNSNEAILAAVAKHGGVRSAARALDIPYSTFQTLAAKARKLASAPAPAPAPEVQLSAQTMHLVAAVVAALQATQAATQAIPAAIAAPVVEKPRIRIQAGSSARAAAASKEVASPEEDEEGPPVAGGTYGRPESRIQFREGRRFIITSAQNNTRLHEGFWDSLQTFCEHNAAELLVSTFAYNKKGWAQPHRVTKDDKSLWYAPELTPHLCNQPTQLAPGLLLCGQAEISPTAVDPLSGFEDFTKACSGIFPHTKVAMKPMPALKGKPERFLYTTGSCTLANYIQRKAGQKAEFDHIIGALVVEVDDDNEWYVRQVNASEDGSFQDLNTVYMPNGIRPGVVEAVTWGDWHIEKQDLEVRETCIGAGGILDTLRPREQHHHDLLDFTARNHHNLKDRFFLADMAWAGTDLVETGIQMCAEFLESASRPWCKQVLMVSNHCEAFERWLQEADGHRDANPDNAIYWLTWNKEKLLAIKHGNRDFSVFEAAIREKTDIDGVTFLRQDESYEICEDHGGIECSIHGHVGVNGSRGSPKGYRGLGIRLNTAHTHSAGITGGTYTAGVSGKKDMGYNKGPGSWSHSHIVTYENGKRTIITGRGSKWRAAN